MQQDALASTQTLIKLTYLSACARVRQCLSVIYFVDSDAELLASNIPVMIDSGAYSGSKIFVTINATDK